MVYTIRIWVYDINIEEIKNDLHMQRSLFGTINIINIDLAQTKIAFFRFRAIFLQRLIHCVLIAISACHPKNGTARGLKPSGAVGLWGCGC